MASGIEWFPLETNLLTDDEKVFDLMDGALDTHAYADFGRFVALLTRIYREGPALRVNRRMERRIAHDLGLDLEGFAAFIGRCVGAGLFHEGMWRDHCVLTSKGIQLRWIRAKQRAKSQGLPVEMRPWSLLDEPDESFDDDEPRCSSLEKLTDSENYPLDKIRQDKTRQEEKREEDSSVSLSGKREVFNNSEPEQQRNVENPDPDPEPSQDIELDLGSLVPPCMARERGDAVFLDDQDAPHRTPYGALRARYEAKTHRRDFEELMANVHRMCPAGCRASPKDVSECYALIAAAFDKADPAKGSPWALTRHVLANDRGPRHA